MATVLPKFRKTPIKRGVAIAKGKLAIRTKGRPPKQPDQISRDEILSAASQLLMSMPIAKVTSTAIAAKVGVHPAMINYYFKTRSELLAATALELLKLPAEGEYIQPGLNSRQGLKARVSWLLKALRAQPFLHRIIVDELVNSTNADIRQTFRQRTLAGFERHRLFLEVGTARRELRPVPAPFFYVAMIGMCEFYTSAQPMLDYALGEDDRADRDAAYVDFICDMIIDGLKAPPEA